MKPGLQPAYLAIALIAALLPACSAAGSDEGGPGVALVIHGGAGTITREIMTPDLERQYRDKLSEALATGHAILREGGSALDAVEATVRLLEDSPLFNAGKGAVFSAEGKNELDASIMDGSTLAAGAVAGVTRIKNPITAARAVMERTPHVLLAGSGAEAFAAAEGLEIVDPSYFFTERRWKALLQAREREAPPGADLEPLPDGGGSGSGQGGRGGPGGLGTVGAVALDREGRIAAATSTGGLTNKKHGRIGDSPIVGAGTYAEAGCGVSGTGKGEFFIRYAVAYDICARMRYQGLPIREAAERVIGILKDAGGAAGVIALDGQGRPALVFNTEGMYRGWILADGVPHVAIYGDD